MENFMAAAAVALVQRFIPPEEQAEELLGIKDPLTHLLAQIIPVTEIPELIGEYAEHPEAVQYKTREYEQFCTGWIRFLAKLNIDPQEVPALSEETKISFGYTCPIVGGDQKVWQTHSLLLLPRESISQLVDAANAYQEQSAEKEPQKPLQITFLGQPWSDQTTHELQWILISNKALPGSFNRPYSRLVELVTELSERSHASYKIPSYRVAIVGAIFERTLGQNSRKEADITVVEEVWKNTQDLVVWKENPHTVKISPKPPEQTMIGVRPVRIL